MTVPPERIALIRRQAEGVLASGGGWNDRTRAGLAALAQVHGVQFEWVLALVSGAELPSAPAAPADAGVVAAGSPAVAGDPAEAPPEPSRVPGIVHRDRDAGLGVPAGVAILFAALALSVGLGWFAFTRSGGPPARRAAPAPVARPGEADAVPAEPGADAAQEPPSVSSTAAVPARVPPVPAIYSRPPGFPPDSLPAWCEAAFEEFGAGERELVAVRDALAGGEPASDADRESWRRIAGSFASCWPLLDGRRLPAALTALVKSHPRLGDAEVRRTLREALERGRASQAADPRPLWSGSGAAGLLAALDRPGDDPLRAFREAALGWLGQRSQGVVATVLAGDPAAAADAVGVWLQAVTAAGSSDATRASCDDRIIGVLDMLVRGAAPMDRPGTVADAAGTMIDAFLPANRERLVNAFTRWLLDPSVESRALHGLTSVLATRRPSPWWDPWLVCGARADPAAREATADRYRSALAAADAAPAAEPGRIRGVKQDTVARWARVTREVLGRPAAVDLPSRVGRVTELVALLEARLMLERGRGGDAEARLAQLEDAAAFAPRENGRWKDGIEPQEVGRALGPDGRMEEDLRRLSSQDSRLDYLRRLRTRPMSDLGPLDAAVLAKEALTGRTAPSRSVVQDVVADQYPRGPNVIAALAAEMPFATDPAESIALAQRLAGRPVPPGSLAERRAAAVLLLLDLHSTLVPAERHRVDALARELAAAANGAVAASGGRSPGALALPEASLRAWMDASLEAARESLPAAALAGLASEADARRRLAKPGPQAAVAELAGILEVLAAVESERRPRSRASIQSVAHAAAEARLAAADAVAQLDVTARAALQLHLEGLGAVGGGR